MGDGMSDCNTCARDHICVYKYKPCDCVGFRKYVEADDVINCTKCGGNRIPFMPVCDMCNCTGAVRASDARI